MQTATIGTAIKQHDLFNNTNSTGVSTNVRSLSLAASMPILLGNSTAVILNIRHTTEYGNGRKKWLVVVAVAQDYFNYIIGTHEFSARTRILLHIRGTLRIYTSAIHFYAAWNSRLGVVFNLLLYDGTSMIITTASFLVQPTVAILYGRTEKKGADVEKSACVRLPDQLYKSKEKMYHEIVTYALRRKRERVLRYW